MKRFAFYMFLLVSALMVKFNGAKEFECQPGVPYKENKCNTCLCNEDRELICTLMLCYNIPNQDRLINCESGTYYEDKCNKCWCVGPMGTVCTDHSCETPTA